jgi:ABC-type sugar transport system substrate-binding protein
MMRLPFTHWLRVVRHVSRRQLLAAAVCGLGAPALALTRPRVVFLNPGEAANSGTGPLWQSLSRHMEMAAADLGLQLDVLYAERDHALMLRQAQAVAQRQPSPDYVVVVNEKSLLPQLLERLAPSSAGVLAIHNPVPFEQRQQLGNERERFEHWIGTAVADNDAGGYRLMEELARRLNGQSPQVLGITGDPATPVSAERAQGVERYLRVSRRGSVLQLVHGDWSYEDAEAKARVLLARYPQANVLWAANDSMALGALGALRGAGAQSPVWVGGMGGWPDALDSIDAGGLAAPAAGHMLIGAVAMVMLSDHARGTDFAIAGRAARRLDYLRVVTRADLPAYRQAVADNTGRLPWHQLARAGRADALPYDEALRQLLDRKRAGTR